jgi:hypothetical protein
VGQGVNGTLDSDCREAKVQYEPTVTQMQTSPDHYKIAWDLFAELRKETLESQKIRAQVIGFKITFVSAAVGLIASNPDKIPSALLVIPAFAAMFFDLLITSYSFSIKRIGHYCRTQIEPRLRSTTGLPRDFLLWHEFLRQPAARQNLAHFGNLGITLLAAILAVAALCNPYRPVLSSFLLPALLAGFAYDIKAHLLPWRFKEDDFKRIAGDDTSDGEK